MLPNILTPRCRPLGATTIVGTLVMEDEVEEQNP